MDYYTDVMDLSHLLESLNQDTGPKYRKLNAALCDLVEDFSLVSFLTLAIEDKESMAALLKLIDKANGFSYGGLTDGNESILDEVFPA
jgi:hypothetical protein